MPNTIEGYRVTRLAFPRDRVVGDSQVRFDTIYAAVLELMSARGHTGTGFFFSAFHPLPSLPALNRVMATEVGHPDLDWDIARLRLVRDIVGSQAPLMVDSNEAWSPGEAIRRLHAYHAAGFEILWAEDPCLRYDFDGLREIMRAVPFTLVNTG